MRDTDYAFAVAKVRQLENTLFNKQQMLSLINAENTEEIKAFLLSKGYEIPDNMSISDMLNREAEENYRFADDLLPDKSFLKVFTVKNDFHNLKAAIKALVSGIDPKKYYIFPCETDCEALVSFITNKDFESLPPYMRETAKSAYEIAAESRDGQMIDVIIDRAALEAILRFSKESGSELLRKYAQLTVAAADIKTAWRGAKAGKREPFFESAICGSEILPKTAFCRAAAKGTDEVLNFIAGSGETELLDALKLGVSELEKTSDIKAAQVMHQSALEAFGPDPVIAFYWFRDMQIRNIRIISVCKEMGIEPQKIAERVRDIYV